MKPTDARRTALTVLLQVAEGQPSDRALDRALRAGGLEPRERGLATELVYGVLRRRRSLDALIAPRSNRSLDQLDAAVLEGLRLGVYQLVHLDRVPAHAAVGATVEAVKSHARGAAGFVNGVLRAVGRAVDADAGSGEVEPFADVPAWWAERWRERYGDEVAGRWFAATLEPSPLTVRPHRTAAGDDWRQRLAAEGVELEEARHAPGAFRVVAGNPATSSLLNAGAISLRGEASQLVASLVGAGPADRFLDACAGRGGKTLQIAEDGAPALVVATDVSRWRVAAARRAAAALGMSSIDHVVADLEAPAPFVPTFTRALVDAPCTGLGTVRRRPELKWRQDAAAPARLAALQRRILDRVADTLAPGASLLYATCSTEPEENEETVEALLAGRSDLELRPVALPAGVEPGLVGADGFFRTYPSFPELDGFFAAELVRVPRAATARVL